MANTFGLFSINNSTFNQQLSYPATYPKPMRDTVVTVLRIHNLALNVLGYIPIISVFSGCIRILTGLAIGEATIAFGDRDADRGMIVGHWYDEALCTTVAQISRGVLEAFVPMGMTYNLILDAIGTVINLANIYIGPVVEEERLIAEGFDYCRDEPTIQMRSPHPEPNYRGCGKILGWV